MKRLLSLLLVIVMALSMIPTVFAQEETVDIEEPQTGEITAVSEETAEPVAKQTYGSISGYFTYSVSDGKAIITNCDTSISGNVSIPATLGGYPVTVIDEFAFQGCSDLTKVTIPNGVTTIGEWAFSWCSNLANVVIPNSVNFIGDSAFYYCKSLTSVIVPGRVTSIGASAFESCTNLEAVTISKGVTAIGDSAFYGCSSMTILVIGDSVSTIGDYAFAQCTSITYVELPNSVTTIGDNAFEGCTNLARLIIGNGVKTIGTSAFESCERLINVSIPDSVTAIGDFAFLFCKDLKSATIGNGVTTIGDWAFAENPSLTKVTIGNGVLTIGQAAFYSCESLTDLTIGNSVTTIGHMAFRSCSSLSSVVIPDSVTAIDAEAFCFCYSLTNVTFGNRVTSIGGSAFADCTKLTAVYYGGSKAEWQTISIAERGNTALQNATIHYAKHSHEYETVVTAPSCSKGGYTTYTCACGNTYVADETAALDHTEVVIEAVAATCTKTGKTAGAYCSVCNEVLVAQQAVPATGHTVVILPAVAPTKTTTGLTEGKECSVCFEILVAQVVIPVLTCYTYEMQNEQVTITGYTGEGGDITIPSTLDGYPVTAIGEYAFNGCSGLTSVVLPDSVVTIGSNAFGGCTGLTGVTIPNSVTAIGSNAFSDCKYLERVYIADLTAWCNIDFASAGANPLFYGAVLYVNDESCADLVIPDDVTAIFAYAFCGSGLTGVSIPESVTTIGNRAFYNCDNLTDLVLPGGVTTIVNYAFYDCSNLTTVTIADSLTTIGDRAFRYCNSLTDIYYNGTQEQWNAISVGSDNECLTNATIHLGGHTHNYEAVVIAPTCTEGGYTTYTCSACDDTYTADETAALEHDYKSEYFEPTTTKDGYTLYTCSRCDDTYTEVDEGTQLEPVGELKVVTHPVGAGVVYPNTWITLSVEVEGGTGELTYRWQKRRVEEGAKWTWTNSYGATAEFKTSKWTHYEYRCRVIDEKNKYVFSDAAGWEKKDSILKITQEPVAVKGVKQGESVTFSVAAESDSVISYQWYRKNKGADTFTATSLKEASFTVTAQTYAEHEYYCVVTDEHGGRKQSKTVSFRTRTKDLLVTEPEATSISAYGETVTFSAPATSYQGTVTYQWQKSKNGGASWFNATGATEATYSFTGSAGTHMSNGVQILYRCLVTDAIGVPYVTKAVTFYVG